MEVSQQNDFDALGFSYENELLKLVVVPGSLRWRIFPEDHSVAEVSEQDAVGVLGMQLSLLELVLALGSLRGRVLREDDPVKEAFQRDDFDARGMQISYEDELLELVMNLVLARWV